MSQRLAETGTFRFGEWQVDPDRRTLSRDGRERQLTPQQMDLLVYLAEQAGQVVSRKQILDAVWAGAQIEEGGLTRCISELRKALGDDAREPRYLETIPKKGYRVVASIPEAATPPAPRGRSLAKPIALGVLGLGAVLLALYAWAPTTLHPGWAAATDIRLPSVSVLGFSNRTEEPSNDWLEPGLTEMLATELALSRRLRVVSHNTTSRLIQEYALGDVGDLPGDRLRRLAAATGADYLITGSLHSGEDGSLSLEVDLWDGKTARPVVSFNEIGGLEDPHSLVSLAGTRLRDALGLPDLSQSERAAVAGQLSRDAAATRLYYDGLRQLRGYDAAPAREALERSLALDPEQPFARIALAEALAVLGYDALAEAAARLAVDSATQLPREHRLWIEARHRSTIGDWDQAIERYRALRLFVPENTEYGLALANDLRAAGRVEESLELLSELSDDDRGDVDPRIALAAGEAFLTLGRYQDVMVASGRAIEQAAELGTPRIVALARRLRASALYSLGRIVEAKAELVEVAGALGAAGDPSNVMTTRLTLATWLQDEGAFAEAHELCRSALALARETGDRSAEARALRILGQALWEEGDPQGKTMIRQSAALYREIGNRLQEATAMRSLAIALASRGSHNEAYPLFEGLLTLYRELGNQEGVGLTLMNLGRVHLLKNEVSRASEFLVEAEAVLEPLGLPNRVAILRVNLGWARLMAGDLDGARDAFAAATAAFRELDNPRLTAVSLYSLGGVSRMQGHLDRARRELLESLELRREISTSGRLAESHLALGLLYYQQADYLAAEEAARAAHELYRRDSIFHGGCTRLLVKAYLARGRQAEAAAAVEEGELLLGGLGTQDESHLFLSMAAAQLAASVDDTAGAIDLLDRIVAATEEEGSWVLHTEADLARAALRLQDDSQADRARRIVRAIEERAASHGWTEMVAKARAVLDGKGSPW